MKNVTAKRGFESVRVALPDPVWEGHREVGTGVSLTGIYFSPRAGRIVLERDSVWDNGHGFCTGESYELVEPDDPGYPDVLALCDKLGVEIPARLETAEAL